MTESARARASGCVGFGTIWRFTFIILDFSLVHYSASLSFTINQSIKESRQQYGTGEGVYGDDRPPLTLFIPITAVYIYKCICKEKQKRLRVGKHVTGSGIADVAAV